MLLWHGSRLTNWVGILSQGEFMCLGAGSVPFGGRSICTERMCGMFHFVPLQACASLLRRLRSPATCLVRAHVARMVTMSRDVRGSEAHVYVCIHSPHRQGCLLCGHGVQVRQLLFHQPVRRCYSYSSAHWWARLMSGFDYLPCT